MTRGPGPAFLAAGLGLGGVSLAAGGTGLIVPVPSPGVEVRVLAGRPSALGRVGPLAFALSLTTADGFLEIHMVLTNHGSGAVKFGPDAVRLLSRGEIVDPLDPRRYVSLRYQVEPARLDADGNPAVSQETGLRLLGPGASDKPLGEALIDQEQEDHEYLDAVAAARELRRFEGSLIGRGGVMEPGQKSREKLVFQRNQVTIPAVVEIRCAGAVGRIRFERR